jgi:uncharacterized membrane protein
MEPRSVTDYVEDDARIAAILLVWSAIASVFIYGVTELGLPFERIWPRLGNLFALTGLLSVIPYILYLDDR